MKFDSHETENLQDFEGDFSGQIVVYYLLEVSGSILCLVFCESDEWIRHHQPSKEAKAVGK